MRPDRAEGGARQAPPPQVAPPSPTITRIIDDWWTGRKPLLARAPAGADVVSLAVAAELSATPATPELALELLDLARWGLAA